MSGCHVVHTELCIHTKIRGFCEFCVIEDLQKKCIELQTRVDSLHAFKLNQITANQKVEKTSRDNYDRLSFFIDSIHVELNKIKEKIACLMQKSSLNHEKRPFSCPTCEGRAYIWTTNSMNVLVSDNCKSCNGTGIVWG